MDGDERYEDRFAPPSRALRRAARAARWRAKGLLGRPRTALLELRWRLGDEVMALPVAEAFARAYPDTAVRVWTRFPELYEGTALTASAAAPDAMPDRYVFLREGPRGAFRAAHLAALAGLPAPEAPPRLRFHDWGAAPWGAPGRPVVALARGATWPTKRWPVDRWEALSAGLRAAGCATAALGLAGEAVAADFDLTGKTTVREAACALHHADLLVCCDSGLMHLALAAGTPAVALFGPTDPDLYVRNQPLFHPLRSGADCAGFWNHSPEPPSPGRCPLGHAHCLEDIATETVLAAALACLAGARG